MARSGYFLYNRVPLTEILETHGLVPYGLMMLLITNAQWDDEAAVKTATEIVKLQRGQALYSHKTYARTLRVPESTLRDAFEKMKKLRYITVDKSAGRATIVTVCGYEAYTSVPESVRTLDRAASETKPRRPRTKEEKNYKSTKRQKPSLEGVATIDDKENHDHGDTAMSPKQRLFVLTKGGQWLQENGDLYVGGDGRSKAAAFELYVGYPLDLWERLQKGGCDG